MRSWAATSRATAAAVAALETSWASLLVSSSEAESSQGVPADSRAVVALVNSLDSLLAAC